jgi:hypothetical protein
MTLADWLERELAKAPPLSDEERKAILDKYGM